MITVLLSSPAVAACGLQVAVRRRTNPNVGPSRRNYELLNSCNGCPIANRLITRSHVLKSAPSPKSPNAGLLIVDIPQACNLRRLNWIRLGTGDVRDDGCLELSWEVLGGNSIR